jgi:hypothetical protein
MVIWTIEDSKGVPQAFMAHAINAGRVADLDLPASRQGKAPNPLLPSYSSYAYLFEFSLEIVGFSL